MVRTLKISEQTLQRKSGKRPVLTSAQQKAMFADYATGKYTHPELGKKYGVAPVTVSRYLKKQREATEKERTPPTPTPTLAPTPKPATPPTSLARELVREELGQLLFTVESAAAQMQYAKSEYDGGDLSRVLDRLDAASVRMEMAFTYLGEVKRHLRAILHEEMQ